MEKLKKLLFGNKLGKAFDNLLKETSGDGFKSKCIVASYISVFTIVKIILLIAIVMVLLFGIGTFTKTDINGDVMISILTIIKDIFNACTTFFAIAVTTTFGATAFASKKQEQTNNENIGQGN